MNKTALRYGFYLNRKENEVKKKEYQYTPRRKYKSAWIKTFDGRRKYYSVKSKTFDGCGNFKSMRITVFDGWRKSESAWIRTFLTVGKRFLLGFLFICQIVNTKSQDLGLNPEPMETTHISIHLPDIHG